jgi:hypothetical protein
MITEAETVFEMLDFYIIPTPLILQNILFYLITDFIVIKINFQCSRSVVLTFFETTGPSDPQELSMNTMSSNNLFL